MKVIISSVLDRVLNLPFKFFVIFVAASRLEIDEQTIFIVEGKECIFLGLVDLEVTFKANWV